MDETYHQYNQLMQQQWIELSVSRMLLNNSTLMTYQKHLTIHNKYIMLSARLA